LPWQALQAQAQQLHRQLTEVHNPFDAVKYHAQVSGLVLQLVTILAQLSAHTLPRLS